MKLEYVLDKNGKELLQDNKGIHQIMMEWERPYMEKCIELLSPHDSILEIGFGMGYSASKIQEYATDITSHVIIECNPTVWERFNKWKIGKSNVQLVKGRWQDMLQILGEFDYIFFDDYVTTDNIIGDFNRFNEFMHEILKNHSKIGTKIGLYSTTNCQQYSRYEFLDVKNIEYNINIPENCKYVKGDKMNIPIITKVDAYNDELITSKPVKKVTEVSKPIMPYYIKEAEKTFTFHILFHPEYSSKINKFCKLMKKRDHNITVYNDNEYVNIQNGDFIVSFSGNTQLPILETFRNKNNNIIIEMGGYTDIESHFKIFESYNEMQKITILGDLKQFQWSNTVIPCYFEDEDFDNKVEKKDYFMFIGKTSKAELAIELCKKADVELVIIGKMDSKINYEKVKLIEEVSKTKRKNLFKEAKGLLSLDNSLESSNSAYYILEAAYCGCPVIVPDNGWYMEIVLHAITGYRCNTFEQMYWAITNIDKIKPAVCWDWVKKNFSKDKVVQMYEDYFTQIYNIFINGWYYENKEREHLDWLYKQYPLFLKNAKPVVKSNK